MPLSILEGASFRGPKQVRVAICVAGDDASIRKYNLGKFITKNVRFLQAARQDGRCPIEDILNVIAGRWKILILWWLQDDELRFGELRRHIPTITQKMLTQQLRHMEEEGLVHWEVFAQVPPKVIYALTERGQSLHAVLRSLYEWSRDHPRQP